MVAEWAERKDISLASIEPGRSLWSGFPERFYVTFRRGVPDIHVSRRLTEVREQAELWLGDYCCEISHDSLGGMTYPNSGNKSIRLAGVVVGATWWGRLNEFSGSPVHRRRSIKICVAITLPSMRGSLPCIRRSRSCISGLIYTVSVSNGAGRRAYGFTSCRASSYVSRELSST